MRNILKYQLLNFVWWTLIATLFVIGAYTACVTQLNMVIEPEFKYVVLKSYLLGLVVTAGITRLNMHSNIASPKVALTNMFHFWLGAMAFVLCLIGAILLINMLFYFSGVDYIKYILATCMVTILMIFMSRFYTNN